MWNGKATPISSKIRTETCTCLECSIINCLREFESLTSQKLRVTHMLVGD